MTRWYEEERRWLRLALGLPPDPPTDAELRAFLRDRLGPVAVPTGTKEKPPQPKRPSLLEFAKTGGLPSAQKAQERPPLKPLVEKMPKLPPALVSAAETASMVIPAFAGVKLTTEGANVLRNLKPAQKPAQIKAIQESTALSAEEKAARLRIIEEGPITTPVASDALSPAAKAAQAAATVAPKAGAQARTAIKVGDTVHRDGMVLGEVVDASDSALLSIRSSQGGIMKAGRATVDETKASVGARTPVSESVERLAQEPGVASTGAPSSVAGKLSLEEFTQHIKRGKAQYSIAFDGFDVTPPGMGNPYLSDRDRIESVYKRYVEGKLELPQATKAGAPKVAEVTPKAKIVPAAAQAPSPGSAVPPVKPPGGVSSPGGGATFVPPSDNRWIGSVRSNDEILGMAYRNDWVRRLADKASAGRTPVAKVLQVLGLPERNVFKQAEVLRGSIVADWESASTGTVARLRSIGDSQKLFAVDKEGRALIGTQRVALNDVLENPQRFADLNKEQKDFIATLHRINDEKLARLTEEGIDMPQLSFEEGGHYVGRRVLGRLDSQGNLQVAATGAGARRPGAKAAFEKPRTFMEGTEEALAAGYRYMKPEDVLQANLEAAGRRIADKRFSDYILGQVPYRTGAAEPELITARDFARSKANRATNYRLVLERSLRGETPPAATLDAIGQSYPLEIEQLRAALGDKQALRGLRPVAQGIIAESGQLFRDARQALTRAQKIARTPHLAEGTVQAPAFAGKFFDVKDADKLNKAMGLAPLPMWASAAQATAWMNAPFRMLVTTYDVGVGGIQLLMAMFKNPITWGKANVRGLEFLVSGPRYERFKATHAETMTKWAPHGAIFTPTEFTETLRPGGLVARIPVVRGVSKPFARYFEGILNAAEIYGLEAKAPSAVTSAEEMADWAAHWNVMTGRFDSARRGISQNQQYLESAVAFAPRFRRAAYTLMTDVARGGIRGEQAREALAKFVLGGTLAYIGLAKALGQEAYLDPRDRGRWMTLEIFGQRVGLGSAYTITMRLLGQVAMDVATGKPEDIGPDAARYAKGLLAPVPGMAVDIAYRPNYEREGIQRTLDLTGRVVSNNMVPAWAGSLIDSGELEWEGKATGALASAASLRAYPFSRISDMRIKYDEDLQPYWDIGAQNAQFDAVRLQVYQAGLREGLSEKEATARAEYAAGQAAKNARAALRAKNPELDAILFITGESEVTATGEGFLAAVRLMKENGISPLDVLPVEKAESPLRIARRENLGVALGVPAVKKSPTATAPQQTGDTEAMRKYKDAERKLDEHIERLRQPTPEPVGAR